MFRVVIPARYASTRLPGKPLRLLQGKPLLQWVHQVALQAGPDEVLIATDDERIDRAARAFGARTILTSTNHASGTDRLAEVAVHNGWSAEDIVVNLQGDEPLMPAGLLRQVSSLLQQWPEAAIATLAVPIQSQQEFQEPAAVKVVIDAQGRALYFSRAAIPFDRDAPTEFSTALRHVGLYAYRVRSLLSIAALAPSRYEQVEKLEQLRVLEAGLEIRVGIATETPGPDVNTEADLDHVSAVLGKRVNQ